MRLRCVEPEPAPFRNGDHTCSAGCGEVNSNQSLQAGLHEESDEEEVKAQKDYEETINDAAPAA